MLAVIVSMRAKPDRVDELVKAITTQAEASLREEPGCLRFDVLRLKDDTSAFLLYEVYADEEAYTQAHRSTRHFEDWNRAAVELLEGQRTATLALPVTPHLMSEAAS